MIPRFIKYDSCSKILVLFDMDGVLAEYVVGENEDIRNNVPGVYLNKRPIKSVIRTAREINSLPNVDIGVLSSASFPNQREEKLQWLSKYAKFIPLPHVHVLIWSELGYENDPLARSEAKGKKILSIHGYDKIYLVDDREKVINATNAIIPNCAHHVSEFIE